MHVISIAASRARYNVNGVLTRVDSTMRGCPTNIASSITRRWPSACPLATTVVEDYSSLDLDVSPHGAESPSGAAPSAADRTRQQAPIRHARWSDRSPDRRPELPMSGCSLRARDREGIDEPSALHIPKPSGGHGS